jgi:hypothetical protein
MNRKLSRRQALRWLALSAASSLFACNTSNPTTPTGMASEPSQTAADTAAPPPTTSDGPAEAVPEPTETSPPAMEVPEGFLPI